MPLVCFAKALPSGGAFASRPLPFRKLLVDFLPHVLYKLYMANEQTHPVLLNLPKSLHRQVKRSAERNLRSVHAEIIRAVQNYVLTAATTADAAEPAPAQPEAAPAA